MYNGQLPATSNRADWEQSFTLVDEVSGEPIDISGCRITISVIYRPRNPNYSSVSSYYYDAVSQQVGGIVLTGSTDTGEITLPGDIGTFTWLFPVSRMMGLPNGEYQIGLRLGQNGSTTQLMIGTIPVYEGFDMQ
jgi:hypothetical protein